MRQLSLNSSIIPDVSVLDPTLSLVLIQIVIIYLVCQILSIIGVYFKQPSVVFEIVGGIILGPSILGKIPGYTNYLFPLDTIQYVKTLSSFGLQIYLFLVGMEIDLTGLQKFQIVTILVAISSMTLPFLGGIAIAVPIYRFMVDHSVEENNQSYFKIAIFIGSAMSITALPVLARILKENLLLSTVPGIITFGAAVISDAVAWVLLVIAISISNSNSIETALWVLFSIVIYGLFIFTVVRKLLQLVIEFIERQDTAETDDVMTNNSVRFILILALFSAWITSIIGIDSIIGAFMIGTI
jgi:Kef-type K+ transport system membrane component KefB